MNKNKITYTTALVTLTDSNITNIDETNNKKIGILEIGRLASDF